MFYSLDILVTYGKMEVANQTFITSDVNLVSERVNCHNQESITNPNDLELKTTMHFLLDFNLISLLLPA